MRCDKFFPVLRLIKCPRKRGMQRKDGGQMQFLRGFCYLNDYYACTNCINILNNSRYLSKLSWILNKYHVYNN